MKKNYIPPLLVIHSFTVTHFINSSMSTNTVTTEQPKEDPIYTKPVPTDWGKDNDNWKF